MKRDLSKTRTGGKGEGGRNAKGEKKRGIVIKGKRYYLSARPLVSEKKRINTIRISTIGTMGKRKPARQVHSGFKIRHQLTVRYVTACATPEKAVARPDAKPRFSLGHHLLITPTPLDQTIA